MITSWVGAVPGAVYQGLSQLVSYGNKLKVKSSKIFNCIDILNLFRELFVSTAFWHFSLGAGCRLSMSQLVSYGTKLKSKTLYSNIFNCLFKILIFLISLIILFVSTAFQHWIWGLKMLQRSFPLPVSISRSVKIKAYVAS